MLVAHSQISNLAYQEAFDLCSEIDQNDIPFVALAIHLKAELWTGDKKLSSGLKKQGFSSVINTHELYLYFLTNDW